VITPSLPGWDASGGEAVDELVGHTHHQRFQSLAVRDGGVGVQFIHGVLLEY
jgi:hypothetical protein